MNIKATFDKLFTNLMIDVTTGDTITYKEINFNYKTIFEEENISIMAYNNETIIAEKIHSIITRNIDNTRMKDYYDIYMFINYKWNQVDKDLLPKAIFNTFKNRGNESYLMEINRYFELIKNDNDLKTLWENYTNNYEYAKGITFMDTINAIKEVLSIIDE